MEQPSWSLGRLQIKMLSCKMKICQIYQIADLKYVAFYKSLIKYRFVPVQFPVTLLFWLLGNPPAGICGWRTKFPPFPSSFPQNRKTERRHGRELPWRQSLFLDSPEHRRANFRLTSVNSEQSHKQMPVQLLKPTLILCQ